MMIQLQEGVKKYGLQIIIWSVLISMGIGYLATLFDTRRSSSQTLTTVNGTPISAHSYEQALAVIEERVQAIKAQFGSQATYFLSIMGLNNTKQYTMNALVSGVLMEQLSDKAGIVVQSSYIPFLFNNPASSYELLSEVLPMSVFDQQGMLSSGMLNNYLKRNNSSYAELERVLLQKIKQSIVQAAARSSSHTLNKQICEAFAQKYQQRSYAYFKLDQEYYIHKLNKEIVEDAQLKAFYTQSNKINKRYWAPEQRQGLLVTFEADRWAIKPSAQEIEQYYTNHKALFVENPAQLQIRHILLKDEPKAYKIIEELKKDPQTFASVAEQHSQDSATASNGGLMQSFVKGSHEPSFEKAAFSIQKDNELAGPVQTSQGWEIIQRVHKMPVSYKSLKEAEQLIVQRLVRQKFSYAFSQYMTQWIAQPDMSLEDLIASKHGTQPTIIICIKSDTDALSKKFFSLKKDAQGFLLQKNQGMLIKLNKIIPAHALDFEACKEQVRADYQTNKAQALLAQDAKTLHQQLHNTTLTIQEFNTIAAQYGQSVVNSPMIDPAEPNDSYASMLGFYQEHMASVVADAQKIMVVYVAQAQAVDQKTFEEKKPEIRAITHHTMQMATLKGLVASLYRNATISNDKALDL